MARISGLDEWMPADGSLFGPLARQQYAALARLRWRIFVNGLRSKIGAFEFGARTVAYVMYSIMGLGLGAGVGATAFALVSDGSGSTFLWSSGSCFFFGRLFPSCWLRFRSSSTWGPCCAFP